VAFGQFSEAENFSDMLTGIYSENQTTSISEKFPASENRPPHRRARRCENRTALPTSAPLRLCGLS
jgi:hypothetical protein